MSKQYVNKELLFTLLQNADNFDQIGNYKKSDELNSEFIKISQALLNKKFKINNEARAYYAAFVSDDYKGRVDLRTVPNFNLEKKYNLFKEIFNNFEKTKTISQDFIKLFLANERFRRDVLLFISPSPPYNSQQSQKNILKDIFRQILLEMEPIIIKYIDEQLKLKEIWKNNSVEKNNLIGLKENLQKFQDILPYELKFSIDSLDDPKYMQDVQRLYQVKNINIDESKSRADAIKELNEFTTLNRSSPNQSKIQKFEFKPMPGKSNSAVLKSTEELVEMAARNPQQWQSFVRAMKNNPRMNADLISSAITNAVRGMGRGSRNLASLPKRTGYPLADLAIAGIDFALFEFGKYLETNPNPLSELLQKIPMLPDIVLNLEQQRIIDEYLNKVAYDFMKDESIKDKVKYFKEQYDTYLKKLPLPKQEKILEKLGYKIPSFRVHPISQPQEKNSFP